MDTLNTILSHLDLNSLINGAAALIITRDLRKAIKLLTVRVDNHEARLKAGGL